MNVTVDISILLKGFCNMYGSDVTFLTQRSEREEIIGKTYITINSILRRYNQIDRLIFCIDDVHTKSFRYGLPYGDLYKSKRYTSEPRYNPEGYKEMVLELRQKLNAANISNIAVSNMEADDLVYCLSKLLFQSGESVLIISADHDLQQLVEYNDNAFIVMYNYQKADTAYHYISHDFKVADSSSIESFFNNSPQSMNKAIILEKHERIIAEKSLFLKIVSGDTSDCIPSCLRYQKKTQTFNYTEKRALQLYDDKYAESFALGGDIETIFGDKVILGELAKNILESVKQEVTQEKMLDVVKKLRINKKYIRLHHSEYPSNLYDIMERECIAELSKEKSIILQ